MRHSPTTSFYQRWAKYLVTLYPAAWRERYGEEMLLIIEDSSPTLTTIFNLFIHLCDAYIHRNLVQGRTPYMLQKIRSNTLTIYGATIIFFVAWFMAQTRITTPTPNNTRTLVGFLSYTTSSPLVNIIHFVSNLLLLLIVLGWLPILLAFGWRALRTRNLLALLFFLLSPISPIFSIFINGPGLFGLDGIAATSLTVSIIFAGLWIGLALVFVAIQRVAPSRRITHYGLYLATAILLIMLIGLVVLPFGLLTSFSAFTAGSEFLFYLVRLGVLILVMVTTFLFSANSLIKGFQVKKASQAPQEPQQQEAAIM